MPTPSPNLDLEELRRELATMQPRQKLYELVKAEMVRRDRWKNRGRGKPFTDTDKRRKPL